MSRLLATSMATLMMIGTAHADYAFVITSTICDNQADSVDYEWSRLNRTSVGKPSLVFFDKSGFKAIESGADFKTAKVIVVAAHGGATDIAEVEKSVFARELKTAHPDAPDEIQFVVCGSAYKPDGGETLLGLIAAEYEAPDKPKETLVDVMSGTADACRLKKPGDAEITDLAKAVYYQSVQTTKVGTKIAEKLEGEWSSMKFPGKDLSFKAYCEELLTGDMSRFPAFIAQVNTKFGAEYLSLINQNSGGDPPYVCGAKTNNKICE